MIQTKTLVKIADNSGAKTAACIKIFGGYQKKTAKLGDFVLVAIQTTKNVKKLKKKQITKALVIRQKIFTKKLNGIYLKFNDNAVLLIDKNQNPFATRILGFFPKKLKTKFNKIASIANYLI